MQAKQCNGPCGEVKDLTLFYRHAGMRDGRGTICAACLRAAAKNDYRENIETKRAAIRKWQNENRETVRQASRSWRLNNPDKQLLAGQNWRKKHPYKNAALASKRANGKLKRTPPWLDELDHQLIQCYYAWSAHLTKTTGIPHEVDHIVPLQGKLVSGLHVPWNLQVLTEDENRLKWNRYEPE